MACRLFGAKPLSKPMLGYCPLDPWEQTSFCLGLNVLIDSYYHKTSNINRTLARNKIVDNSDVVGASPVGAAPTTSSFLT